jgi:polyhydroxyalkanoate synthesis regulator phasin
MPQRSDWRRRALATGMQVTELRRSQAGRLVSHLVAQRQLGRGQLGAVIDELVEIGRRRSEDLRNSLRSGADRQFGVLGLATQRDLAALESRLRPSTAATTAKSAAATARRTAVRKPVAAATTQRAR